MERKSVKKDILCTQKMMKNNSGRRHDDSGWLDRN